MMRRDIERTPNELNQLLEEQIEFLFISCQNYDKGQFNEAKRMSTSIRNIVHDTKNSNSLFNQLGIKGGISYYRTVWDREPNFLISHVGLCHLVLADVVEFSGWYPLAYREETKYEKIDFETWWNEEIINDSSKNAFSRKDIILNVCNTDGGAHIDSKLDQVYSLLSRGTSSGWILQEGKTERNEIKVHLATIRQITHELLMTIKDQLYPNLLYKPNVSLYNNLKGLRLFQIRAVYKNSD